MKTHCIVLFGPPASGKTTWANQNELPLFHHPLITRVRELVEATANLQVFCLEMNGGSLQALVKQLEDLDFTVSYREFFRNEQW